MSFCNFLEVINAFLNHFRDKELPVLPRERMIHFYVVTEMRKYPENCQHRVKPKQCDISNYHHLRVVKHDDS